MDHLGNRLAVVDIARREHQIEQFPAVIEDQMELESKKPPSGGLPTLGQPGKDLVGVDPRVLANRQGCGIHERNPRAKPQTGTP